MIGFLQSAFSSKLFMVSAIFLFIYIYLKKVVYSYWKNHQVPHDKPTLIIGTVNKELIMQKISLATLCKNSYDKFKSHPFHGMYTFLSPTLMVNDPDLIKDILIKDFSHFAHRGLSVNEDIDPLSCNIIQITGEKWNAIRAKCSVFFTPNRLKNIIPILSEIADEAITVSKEHLLKSDVIEMKEFLERYFIDVIFSIAFGAEAGTLRNPNNSFHYYGNLSMEMRPVQTILAFFFPKILEIFKICFFDPKSSKFFTKLFKDMVEKRKKQNEKRKDFLNLLIDLMEKEQIIEKDDEDTLNSGFTAENASRKLTEREATAQAFVFFLAGFETSSSNVSFTLYELALNPDIQEKLHEEIDDFLQSSKPLNFENIMNLKYLDMVFTETLRKHPLLPFLNRICVKDYQIPNSNYCIPKGMRIIISVYGIHRDPNYYPDPDKFDPTRFNKENSSVRRPGTYLPFGMGPRHCFGQRLGLVQSKVILLMLLSNYKFLTCEKTPRTLEYALDSFVHKPNYDMHLRLVKRK